MKKNRRDNQLVEVDNKKHAENLIKIKAFHNFKSKTYPHGKLNYQRELSETGSYPKLLQGKKQP